MHIYVHNYLNAFIFVLLFFGIQSVKDPRSESILKEAYGQMHGDDGSWSTAYKDGRFCTCTCFDKRISFQSSGVPTRMYRAYYIHIYTEFDAFNHYRELSPADGRTGALRCLTYAVIAQVNMQR
jgi:hypothetical protein